jgi:tRNA(Ile2) C34 agmatinyltransferase TiaS
LKVVYRLHFVILDRDYKMDNECSLCGGQLELLGYLGNLAWFRCRNCGMEFSFEISWMDDEEYHPIG